MDEADLLGRLRDIHTGAPPPWPPAPGWWLVLLTVLALAALTVWLLRRRHGLRRAALAELRRIERRWHADGDPAALAAGLSLLLRRVALAKAPRADVAGLTGEAWLAWLDAGVGPRFASGPGRALLTLPFGGGGGEQAEALLDLARRWLEVRA